MTIKRPETRSLAWRLPLLAVSIATLAYSLICNVDVVPPPRTASQRDLSVASSEPNKSPSTAREYNAIAQHPLFEPLRRPWYPPKAAIQNAVSSNAVPSRPADYTLVGLVLTANQHTALLRDRMGRTQILREQDKIEGWSVGRIDPIGILLYFGKNTIQITMHKQAR